MNTIKSLDLQNVLSPHAMTLAWEKVRGNGGCSGGDNVSLKAFERRGAKELSALAGRARNGTYMPGPLRPHDIPKEDGDVRTLAIPTIADRILQTAMAAALVPPLEARFHPDSYGYRPGKSVQMAVDRVQGLRSLGYTHVVEADIDRAFDSFPHSAVLDALAPLTLPEPTHRLIALWLEHFGIELGTPGKGLAQGSPLSPLLANAVLDQLDDAMDAEGFRIVRFADDFLLMTKTAQDADRALVSARDWLAQHGMRMNPDGSRIVSFERGFAFLGKLFVLGTTMDEPDDTDAPTRELMRQIAEDDTEEEKAVAAGHDATARVLYVIEKGRRLTMSNRSFVVESEHDEPLIRLSHARVSRIELGPRAHVEPAVLRQVLDTETDVAFVDGRGATKGVLSSNLGHHAALHMAQARIALDPALACDLARRIVEGRIRNQRARLRVLARKDDSAKVASVAAELGRILRKLPRASDVAALRGHEGRAAAIYFPALAALCPEEPAPFKRSRPAQSPLNAAMNYLSALLERDIHSAVVASGLHPGIGALHTTQDRGAACVWDLMEGFRALLGEGLAVTLFRKKRLRPDMFDASATFTVICA